VEPHPVDVDLAMLDAGDWRKVAEVHGGVRRVADARGTDKYQYSGGDASRDIRLLRRTLVDQQLGRSWLERVLSGFIGGDTGVPSPVPAVAARR